MEGERGLLRHHAVAEHFEFLRGAQVVPGDPPFRQAHHPFDERGVQALAVSFEGWWWRWSSNNVAPSFNCWRISTPSSCFVTM